jgi:hypothetical protein
MHMMDAANIDEGNAVTRLLKEMVTLNDWWWSCCDRSVEADGRTKTYAFLVKAFLVPTSFVQSVQFYSGVSKMRKISN